MKWYVVVETQADSKDYLGITEDPYCGDGTLISLHDSEEEAEQACVVYAQEWGLPLFAHYREVEEIKVKKEMNSKYVCPICGEVYYSDFPYLVGYCFYDNAEMKRQEAEKPCK